MGNFRILGAFIGFLIFGPLGLFVGWWIGGMLSAPQGPQAWFNGSQPHTQDTFFRVTFQTIGHIAKADGRVCEREILHARDVMSRMGLDAQKRREAMQFFDEGKQPGFDLDAALNELKQACGWHTILKQLFVQIQMQATKADGRFSPEQEALLKRISQQLGVSGSYQQAHGQYYQSYGHQSQQRGGSNSSYSGRSSLQNAYETLGIKSDANQSEVKRAYRKLMSEYHPDKLMAKGLPDSMIKMATEKTQTIRSAYDAICQAKGWS
mgnify:CR=1 FL=1